VAVFHVVCLADCRAHVFSRGSNDGQTYARDVQMLAGRSALSTTQRYIEADAEAQEAGRGLGVASAFDKNATFSSGKVASDVRQCHSDGQ
jgi:hypothetical protein